MLQGDPLTAAHDELQSKATTTHYLVLTVYDLPPAFYKACPHAKHTGTAKSWPPL